MVRKGKAEFGTSAEAESWPQWQRATTVVVVSDEDMLEVYYEFKEA